MSSENNSRFKFGGMTRRLGVGLLIALPLFIPTWIEYQSLRQSTEQLQAMTIEVRDAASNHPRLRDQLATRQSERQKLRSQLVHTSDREKYQNELVEIIRRAKCHLRKISASNSSNRSWYADDNVLDPTTPKVPVPSRFELHSTSLTLTVAGTVQAVLECMRSIQQAKHFKHIRKIYLSPDQADPNTIALTMEIVVFDFQQVRNNPFDIAD